MEHSDGSIKVRFGNQVEVKLGGSLQCGRLIAVGRDPHLLLFPSFQADPHHLRPRVPFGPAHPHLCEVDRLRRILR